RAVWRRVLPNWSLPVPLLRMNGTGERQTHNRREAHSDSFCNHEMSPNRALLAVDRTGPFGLMLANARQCSLLPAPKIGSSSTRPWLRPIQFARSDPRAPAKMLLAALRIPCSEDSISLEWISNVAQ